MSSGMCKEDLRYGITCSTHLTLAREILHGPLGRGMRRLNEEVVA
jgi:hypothetical protein